VTARTAAYDARVKVKPRTLLVPLLLFTVGGCGGLPNIDAVPNMDATGSGCANRSGDGPRGGDDPEGIPLEGIAGLTPEQASMAAAAKGHVAVFRLNSMACVCVPPTGYGPVAEGWWGSRGQLYIDLGDVRPRGQQLADGQGCPSPWPL
jgi:hypothetical protein